MDNDNDDLFVLQYRTKTGRYKDIGRFGDPFEIADYLRGKISDDAQTYLKQHVSVFFIRGAKCSLPALDGGRYQIKG